MPKMNGRLVSRFIVLAKPHFFSDEKWIARGLLTALIALMLANTAANVLLNQQTGEFTSAIAARDSSRYWQALYYMCALIAINVPIFGIYYFVRDRLANHWRRWMTRSFLEKYFRNAAFYKLTFAGEIDNPDQRISDDINSFTTRSIYFLLLFVETTLQLIAFSGVLWSISQILVYFLLAYALIGTLITVFVFGRPLVGLNFFQLRREADLRFSLVRVRENAESIAFYQGEKPEMQFVKQRFDDVFKNFNRLISWQFFLNVFQNAYITATLVLPGAILAPRVMSGDLEIGRVVQATGAFAAIFGALNLVVNKFDILSFFAAGISRLDRFATCLEHLSVQPPEDSHIHTVEQDLFAVEKLDVQTPDGKRTLVKDLSVTVPKTEGLLIVGASGGGKSSLLRVFAGIWDFGHGSVMRPPLDDMLFLPQRPYMIIGSLRDQLLYPKAKRVPTDDELASFLETVNLPNLIERCGGLDAEADWGKLLSLGEQQRLAFARILVAERKFIVLDEATSALDENNENHLYEVLQTLGVTLISVSHHSRVARFHSEVLVVSGKETWQLHHSEMYLSSEQEHSEGGVSHRAAGSLNTPGSQANIGRGISAFRSR